MSFYGQVVYEFTKLFNKFKFKNKGLSNDSFPKDGDAISEFGYEAVERWDEITFETGNRWIQMIPDITNKGIKVFHSKPSEKVSTSSTFLPKDMGEGVQVKQLDAGQSFEVPEYGIDDAGHISKINLKYYQLPITDFESNLDELNAQMTDLYDAKADQAYRYAEEVVYKYAKDNVKALNDRIDELPSPRDFNSLKDSVGNLGNIYNFLDAETTIVSTIGQVDGDLGYSKNIANMKDDDADTVYSVSEALSAEANQIISLKNTILNLQTLVSSLITRIEKLENK